VGWRLVCRLIFLLVCRSVRSGHVSTFEDAGIQLQSHVANPIYVTTPSLPFRENLRLAYFGSEAGIVGVLFERKNMLLLDCQELTGRNKTRFHSERYIVDLRSSGSVTDTRPYLTSYSQRSCDIFFTRCF
jgi:hypothetical protein